MNILSSSVAAIAACALLSTAGYAATQPHMSAAASVDLQGVSYKFTPLDPSSSFTALQNTLSGSVFAGTFIESGVPQFQFGGTFFGANSTTSPVRDISGDASNEVGTASSVLQVTGTPRMEAAASLDPVSGRGSMSANANSRGDIRFELTGPGFFYVTIPATVSVAVNSDVDGLDLIADAFVILSYVYGLGPGTTDPNSGDGSSLLSLTALHPEDNGTETTLLGVGFFNPGGTMRGSIVLSVNTSLAANPIPEPGTWWMLAGGLSILAVMRRQR